MARPVQHTATSAAADTASAGIIRGVGGAILGGVVATAIFIGGGMLLGSAAYGLLNPLDSYTMGQSVAAAFSGSGSLTGTLGGIAGLVTGVMSGGIAIGAAIGGGTGALGGLMGPSNKIQAENAAAQNMSAGHKMQMEQQVSAARGRAAEEYGTRGYKQGAEDGFQKGQQAIVQQLQQAAQEQVAGAAAPEAPQESKFADKILSEKGMDSKVALASKSQVEKLQASKGPAVGEQALGA